jgi:hypothetical protein
MWEDGEGWNLRSVCKVFVLLAVGAPFDVLGDPLVHSWPPVGAGDLSNGFIPSWVACDWPTVVIAKDSSLYRFDWRDHQSLLGSPPSGGGYCVRG